MPTNSINENPAADGCLIEAPLAQESVGPNPTDREKKGSKRNLLVEENGVPLAVTVVAANRHDSVGLDDLLAERFVRGGLSFMVQSFPQIASTL